MRFNRHFPEVYPVCINLKGRKNKRKRVKKHLKSYGINTNFYTAKLHEHPKRGCLESHLNVIQNAVDNKHNYLLIFEDDALFIRDVKNLPKPPKDWDMLYLGGTVKHIFQEYIDGKKKNEPWVRMTCWAAHSYIINLKNKDLVTDILKARNEPFSVEIDTYYIHNIQYKYNAYMIKPMRCVQKEGYSDIENRQVNYSFMEDSINGLQKPKSVITESGDFKMHLNDIPDEKLPKVSIITPTRNREWIFLLPKFNLSRFIYPPNKIEWIIVDSSDEDDLKYHFLNNKRVKYIHVDEPCTIAHKRNLACSMAEHPVIVHMDDDDIYPPESLLCRVKALMSYKDIKCVGCSRIGVYDIINDNSYISSDGVIALSEASMAYSLEFWKENNFDPGCERGEYMSFIQNRTKNVLDLPYIFVIFALNHHLNFTQRNEKFNKGDVSKKCIRHKQTGEIMSFKEAWDEELQTFISDIRSYILNSRGYLDKKNK